MVRFSPIGILFLFGFIGIVTHKLGLWLSFGIIAAALVAGARHRQSLANVGGPEGLAAMSDADLLHAYQRTDGEPGNPEADALLAEIERRGLGL